jgi:uncharacterized protein (DUF1330 family)
MNTHYTVALAMLIGVGVGGMAVQSLKAQTTPPFYFVGEIEVSDPEGYSKEYAPKAVANIRAAGGRFLAVGSGPKVHAYTGEPPKRVILIQWESLEKIQAWRDGEYKEIRKIGEKYAKFPRGYVIEGLSQ